MADTLASIAAAVTSARGTAPTHDRGRHHQRGIRQDHACEQLRHFLTLLTTQLRNQNPLDPLDTNQFTQQLVQFAGVEQQINMNQQLTSLVTCRRRTRSPRR